MGHGGDIYTEGILLGKKLLDFSSNVNPLPVSSVYKEHLEESLDLLPLYPDIKYRDLRKNLINYLYKSNEYFSGGNPSSLRDYIIEPQNILLGNGASELLDLTVSALKSITIVTPAFIEYEENARKHGLKINYSYLNKDFQFDYNDIIKKIEGTEGLIIANPNNPNGCIIDHEEFIRIMDFCEKNEKVIIVDEAFIEFVLDNNQSLIKYINKYNCLVIIRCITKFFSMAGVRLGYGITNNRRILDHINKYQNPWSINCFAELAVKYAIFDEEFIKASIHWLKKDREVMLKALRQISFIDQVYESYGNYFLCALKGINSIKLSKLLKEKGILIRNCDNYKGLNDSYVRIALKNEDQNKKLLEALEALNF